MKNERTPDPRQRGWFRWIVLVALACRLAMGHEPVDSPDVDSLTWEALKDLGRRQSRYLRNSDPETSDSEVTGGKLAAEANVAHYEKTIRRVLHDKCVSCHGPDEANGNLRVDQLDPNLLTGADIGRWRGIYKVLSNAEMPPEDEPQFALSDEDRSNMVEWLSEEIRKASIVRRRSGGRSSFRRMTNYEYQYALQDLLGLPHAFASPLPPEVASDDGFKNDSQLLQMSAMQFGHYREIGLQALRRAITIGPRPPTVIYVLSMQEQMEKALAGDKAKPFDATDAKQSRRQHLRNTETGQAVAFSATTLAPRPEAVPGNWPAPSAVVHRLPAANELKLNLDRFLPDEGIMRVSIRVGRTTLNPQEHASLRLIFSAHTSNNANFSEVISRRDVPVTASMDDPQWIHFEIPLSEIQRNPFRKLATRFPRRDEFLSIRNVSNANNRDEPLQVAIEHVEVTAPYYDSWPPRSHTSIFFESEHRSDEQAYGREVLRRFIERAWRRPATTEELEPLMRLFGRYRSEFETFEEAMTEVLATVLATPEFLYVTQRSTAADSDRPGKISDVELASRLSFFLWSSVPDHQLMKLAMAGRLSDPPILAAQVERMLQDSRAQRFSKHFVQQWLGMDGLGSVNHIRDDSLKEAMAEEPIAFFDEVLRSNGSVLDFLHCDYVVVNERLATHYGVAGVRGPQFRRVPIEATHHRGGILTAAAILTMNSDGKDSHPLKRGIWLLEHVLQDPPPPPPPDVPEVDLTDPRILQMTLKERIADHRNKPACSSCHAKIDPWGIAFENYDALGTFRTSIAGKPVDAKAALFNKHEIAGMDGLKRYLLTDRQDQFVRAVVSKMSAYALGRSLSFGDSADIDQITQQVRREGDGLRDLIQWIVASDLFHANDGGKDR